MTLILWLLVSLPSASTAAWSYTDESGRKFEGSGSNPRIVCHPDACDSLSSMGVGLDQLVGYFGTVPKVRPCHGSLCSDVHFEKMVHVGGEGQYDVDVDKLKNLKADVLVDYTYSPIDPASYKGLLQYSPQLEEIQDMGINMIQIQVAHTGYTEVVDTIQRLATALGAPANHDTAHYCNMMHEAMIEMIRMGKNMWASGERVLAASITETKIYAADPTDDPILIMLEELGIPMLHVNVTDPRGHYWEYIDFGEKEDRNTANIVLSGGGSFYPVDVWLYDARQTRYHEEDITITDPAWDAGQYTIWPIDSPFSYEQGTRILNTLFDVFAKAKRVQPKSDCTIHDVFTRANLAPGSWACNHAQDMISSMPSCPADNSPSSTEPMAWSFEFKGKTVSGTTKNGKPRIVCHPDACENLWSMGLRTDQLVGYFSSVSDLCHGRLCHQFHFESMSNVHGEGRYDIEVTKLEDLKPDLLIDYSYSSEAADYDGLLKYSPQLSEIQALGVPMLDLQVAGKDFVEVVKTFQRLAIALGHEENHDLERHCEELQESMKSMRSLGSFFRGEGLRVLAASFTPTKIYAAQPTDDPILIMLENLGVPILHVNVTDPRGSYWEYIDFGEKESRDTANIVLAGGGSLYPVDVWLYDARSTRYHEEDITITDPAWDAGQYTIWPIDGAFTYEQGTRILNTLRQVFATSKRKYPKTDCTITDLSRDDKLAPGAFACNDPQGSQTYIDRVLPSCGTSTSTPPMTNQEYVSTSTPPMTNQEDVSGVVYSSWQAGAFVVVVMRIIFV